MNLEVWNGWVQVNRKGNFEFAAIQDSRMSGAAWVETMMQRHRAERHDRRNKRMEGALKRSAYLDNLDKAEQPLRASVVASNCVKRTALRGACKTNRGGPIYQVHNCTVVEALLRIPAVS